MNYASAIAALKQADSILAEVIEQVGECRLDQEQQTGDLFLALSKAILYQQLSGKSAAAIHGRFVQLYPQGVPTPQAVLVTSDQALRAVGISRPKIVYLKDLAQHILDGLPTLTELTEMDDETIIRTLTPVKGIGRWTVQMLLMFGLHRWDVLPTDDLGIRSGIRRIYQLAELPDKKTIESLAQPWRPYRTIACWYLWRST